VGLGRRSGRVFLNSAKDKQIVRQVLKCRGRYKVTVDWLRKHIAWTRGFSNSLLEDRLHEGGLAWLRRRGKMIVTKEYLKPRIAYCSATIKKQQNVLNSWAYSDGTVFYLDRTEDENEHSHRAALGGWVWKRSDHKDSMYQECLAPSSYKKAQGVPVRVWGVLAQGKLYIEVLAQGEVMNQELYVELIEDKFPDWLKNSSYLVQDFERCLRSPPSLHALKQVGIELVGGYPVSSQDFNAIENCWKILRARLHETMPIGLEARAGFIERLEKAVQWMNRNKKQQMWHLSTNQKQRCRDCLSMKPKGGRTKW